MVDQRKSWERPTGSNADEWLLFLGENPPEYCAVQIAEAIEEAERNACERAIDRMGWPEIDAFHDALRKGQGVDEDGGGFMLRAIKRLFGIKTDPVVTYRMAATALVQGRDAEAPARAGNARPDAADG